MDKDLSPTSVFYSRWAGEGHYNFPKMLLMAPQSPNGHGLPLEEINMKGKKSLRAEQ